MATQIIIGSSVYNISIYVRDFQPILDYSKIPQGYLELSRDYVKNWCEDWNFRNGRCLLAIKIGGSGLEFMVSDVIGEVANP